MLDDIKEKIIKYQDYYAYMFHNLFEVSGFGIKYFDKYSEKELLNILSLDKEFLKKLNINTLLSIGINAPKENTELVYEIINEKLANKEHIFEGNNYERNLNFGGFRIHNFIITKYFDKEYYREFTNNIQNTINNIKDEELLSALMNSTVQSADNFIACLEKGYLNEEKLEFIKYICRKNRHIMANINYNVFQDDIYDIGIDFIETIIPNINICGKLLIIHDTNINLFNICKKIFKNLEKENLQTRNEIIEKVLFFSLKNIQELENISNIEPYEFLNMAINSSYKYGSIPEDKIYFENDEHLEKLLNDDTLSIEQLKNIICNRLFSKSLTETKNILSELYTNIRDIKEFDSKNEIKNKLDYLNNIINLNSKDELISELFNPKYTFDPYQMLKFINNVKYRYANTFKYVLNRTNSRIDEMINLDKETGSNQSFSASRIIFDKYENKYITISYLSDKSITHDTYNGKNITIIPVPDTFSFIVTSTDTGFKEEKVIENNSFVETYINIQDSQVTKTSSVFITNDNLGITPAGNKGVYYAYTNIPSEYINIMSNIDANSHIRELSFISSEKITYGASSISDNIRQVYGELVINKTNPDYIILFNDSSEEVVINSYRAASEWNIPIIYINKHKVLKNQFETLDNLYELLVSTNNIEILEELLSTYESNVAGFLLNRSEEVDESYTSSINNQEYNSILSYKNKIYELVKKIIINSTNEDEIKYIQSVLITEKNKYIRLSNNLSKTKISYDVDTLIELTNERLSIKITNR